MAHQLIEEAVLLFGDLLEAKAVREQEAWADAERKLAEARG